MNILKINYHLTSISLVNKVKSIHRRTNFLHQTLQIELVNQKINKHLANIGDYTSIRTEL